MAIRQSNSCSRVSERADGGGGGVAGTVIVTVASDEPVELVRRYWKVKPPLKPAPDVKLTPPSVPTVSEPPVPKAAVVPAVRSVTAPPRVPPPNDATTACGAPRLSFASTPGAATVSAPPVAVYASACAAGASVTASVAAPTDVPAVLASSYWKLTPAVLLLAGVNVKLPSALTWSVPPLPSATVAPAAPPVPGSPSVPTCEARDGALRCAAVVVGQQAGGGRDERGVARRRVRVGHRGGRPGHVDGDRRVDRPGRVREPVLEGERPGDAVSRRVGEACRSRRPGASRACRTSQPTRPRGR
jgi:hypothetical protein